MLNGQTLQVSNEDGEWVIDDSFLILVNASDGGVEFVIPPLPAATHGARSSIQRTSTIPSSTPWLEETIILGGRSLKLLSDQAHQLVAPPQPKASS